MNMKSFLLAAALLTAGAANAAVFQNGNFENGMANWQIDGNAGVTGGCCGGPAFYFGAGSAAQNGNFALAFNAGNTTPDARVSQVFDTILGHNYTFSFDFGTTVGPSQSIRASILGNELQELGSLLVSDDQSTNLLTRFSFNFSADGETAWVVFTDLQSNATFNLDAVVDNVVIASNQIPEPGSLALLGLGALALLGSRLKKA